MDGHHVADSTRPVRSVIGFNMFKQKKIAEFMANRPEPEFPVTAMVTKAQDWVPTIEAIGFIEPNQGVTLSSELAGTIDKISFESGAQVKADQLLLSLDSSVEKANLNASQARLPAARAKFERYQNLYQKNSISRISWMMPKRPIAHWKRTSTA